MHVCWQWVGCDNRTCRRWVHVECEVSGGNQVDSTAFYLCPNCREVFILYDAHVYFGFWDISMDHNAYFRWVFVCYVTCFSALSLVIGQFIVQIFSLPRVFLAFRTRRNMRRKSDVVACLKNNQQWLLPARPMRIIVLL